MYNRICHSFNYVGNLKITMISHLVQILLTVFCTLSRYPFINPCLVAKCIWFFATVMSSFVKYHPKTSLTGPPVRFPGNIYWIWSDKDFWNNPNNLMIAAAETNINWINVNYININQINIIIWMMINHSTLDCHVTF